MTLRLRSRHRSFEGWLDYCEHDSVSTQCPMRFSIYRPDTRERRPILYWLSGLTCTDENFMQKSGVQRFLSKHKFFCVAMDTSPRDLKLPRDKERMDLGEGAGFYVNATQEPWSKHYKLYDYVAHELPELLPQHFPIDGERQSIFGHSMGGHGALVIGLRNRERFRSISALAPIGSSMNSRLGKIALPTYLGEDRETWKAYDASEILSKMTKSVPILIDQGLKDEFFIENSLGAEYLEAASKKSGIPIQLNMRKDYDHSYFFVATFIEDHISFHAKYL